MSRSISERAWQSTVVDTATRLGWSVYHTHDSRRSNPGWPDLALWHVRLRRFMLRELKTDKGRLSSTQTATIAALAACGVDVDVWRPADWPTVVEDLSKYRKAA